MWLLPGSALFPVQTHRVGHCQGHDKGKPHLRADRGSDMKSPSMLRGVLPRLFGLWLVFGVSAGHASEDTIKIGILHSLSGTMAISESVLKDTVLMLIEDQSCSDANWNR